MAIARSLLEQILGEAAGTPDREVCGLLLGDGERVSAIIPTANVADDPSCSFEVDPRVLFAASRAERAGGAKVIGHYHSHPNGVAAPSPRDAAAAEPGWLWLIVGGGEATLWIAEGQRAFGPVELELLESD